MAVQAQYPSNAFSPDFRASSRFRNNVLEELQMFQDRNHGSLLAAYTHLGRQVVNNGTVFSDPQSELTCNASASRKRVREEAPTMTQQPDANLAMQQLLQYPNMGVATTAKSAAVETLPAAGNQVSGHQIRLLDSAAASTSGRPPVASPLAQDLVSHLYHQNIEIDALVRVQSERLRSGLEEARKRHCRALFSVLEQRIAKRLKEKDLELENASRRNAELEEKVRQMAAESQIWFNVAKNNEAVVSSLRASLEQILLQNNGAGGCGAAGAQVAEEGFWDSEASPAAVFPADDAGSCCFDDGERERREAEALRGRRACKSCGERDVCVLLLPCRHLCLCRDCESRVDTCPVCHAVKNACLQVFIS